MKVRILVHHDCSYDTRVLSHAESLAATGHLTFGSLPRLKGEGRDEIRNGFAIHKIALDPLHRRWMRFDRRQRRRLRRLLRLPVAGRKPFSHRLLQRLGRPFTVLDYSLRAYREIKHESDVDVYHAHDLPALPVAARLAKRNGGRLVVDFGELFPESAGMSRVERTIWRFVERRFIKQPDYRFACSESKAEVLRNRCGVGWRCCWTAGRKRRRRTRGRVSACTAKVGLDPSEPILLHHGALHGHRARDNRRGRRCSDGRAPLFSWGMGV